jgi:ribosomal-protein-alanine N-acetyltransferase
VAENIASRRVLERLGFVYEKDARYYGLEVMYYGIRRHQFRPDGSFYRLLAPKLNPFTMATARGRTDNLTVFAG